MIPKLLVLSNKFELILIYIQISDATLTVTILNEEISSST